MATLSNAHAEDSENAPKSVQTHNYAYANQNWRDDNIIATRGGGVVGYPTGYDWGSAITTGQGQIFPTGRS
jgi:hypothetical protein